MVSPEHFSVYRQTILSYLERHSVSNIDLKAVLFDMDGVLFDSMPIHAEAWMRSFREEGLDFTEEEAYLHEGRTGSGTIDIVFNRMFHRNATLEETQRIYRRKSDLFDASPQPPVMPHSLELLNRVREDKLNRVLVTGSGQQALLGKLSHHFPGHFSASRMVTAYDVSRGKPDPEPYLKGLQKAGIAFSNAVVVENAPLGVMAAKAAGIFTIAVNTGKLRDHHLLDAGADLLFCGMAALNRAWPQFYEAVRQTKQEKIV